MIVTMVDNGNGYWTNLSIYISWDSTEHGTKAYLGHPANVRYSSLKKS